MKMKFLVTFPDSQSIGLIFDEKEEKLIVGGYCRTSQQMISILNDYFGTKNCNRSEHVGLNKIRIKKHIDSQTFIRGLKDMKKSLSLTIEPVRSFGRLMR